MKLKTAKLFSFLIFVFWAVSLQAQQVSITGQVLDAGDNQPLSGVSVRVKESKQTTLTDESGMFSISSSKDETLIFSYVGYITYEEKVGNQTQLNILLKQDSKALEEAFVVAYGTATKGTFTGSAEVVSAEQIKDNPKTSFEQALTGKVPGLQATTTSGQAGATSAIRIRGIGSMNASNEPLYVIDGVPVTSGSAGQMTDYISGSGNNVMSTLNPNDIESVTVLKDAAASSLYGSRAANGVIIISTKKGKLGAPKINLKSSIGLTPSWATGNWEAGDPQDQINILYRILHDARTSSGETDEQANNWVLNRFNNNFGKHGYSFSTNSPGLYENVNISGLTDGIENREGKFYDWENALFRTGVYQTNDLSVSGATENTNYYSSLSYTKDKSRMIENDYNRISGRVNFNQNIGKYLEFGSNVNIAHTKTIGLNDTRNLGTNYLFQTRNLLWPFYWPTDYKTGNDWTARYGSLAYNPLYFNTQWDNSANTKKISAIESLTLKVLPELTVKTIFSFDNTETKDKVYYSPLHYNGLSSNGEINDMSTNYTKLVSSSTANYDNTFNGVHHLNVLVGFEAEKNNTEFIRATGRDLPSSTLHTVATAGELEANAYSWGNNMMSVLSRIEYDFEDKYYASGSFRRDGSSRLGPDNRWGNFWSLAGSWRLSSEDFLRDSEIVDDLRIRASYGVNGTLPSANYGWRSLTSYTFKYMEQPGSGLTNVVDPSLTWETNYTSNFGLDFSLLNNKLFGSIEYFNRDSKNLLQNVPISTITGFSTTLRNIGQINNRGIEFQLGSDIITEGDWKWSAALNGVFLKSKVVKLYKGEDDPQGQDIIWNDPTGGDSRTRFIYREGESTLSFYGIEWAGVDQSNGQNVWYVNDDSNGDFDFKGRAASYDYRKANRIIMGDGNPDVYGGLNTQVTFKNISLGLNFIYKLGGNLYDAASRDVADDGYYWERIHSKYFIDNTWTDLDPSGTLPKVRGTDMEDVNQVSSRHLYDASFLRLKNLNIAYALPQSTLHKIGVQSARIYFDGMNLLTFAKYKQADPEVNHYSTRGWETPIGKIYTLGVELSF